LAGARAEGRLSDTKTQKSPPGVLAGLRLNDEMDAEMDGEKQGSTFFGGASTVFRVRKITKIAVPGSVEVLASSAGVALAHDDRIGRAHCNSR